MSPAEVGNEQSEKLTDVRVRAPLGKYSMECSSQLKYVKSTNKKNNFSYSKKTEMRGPILFR